MNPQEIFCPNNECPARGQIGKGNIRIHSRKEQRYIGRECRKTFKVRKGTIYYRLRSQAEKVFWSASTVVFRRLTIDFHHNFVNSAPTIRDCWGAPSR